MQKQQNISLAKIIKSLAIIAVFAFAFVSHPNAQMFDLEETNQTDQADQTDQASNDDFAQEADVAEAEPEVVESQPQSENVPDRSLTTNRANSYAKKNQNQKVTIDTVEKINPIDPDEKVYMYMRDFKISRNINGRITCDVRFYLESKVKEKITNISYRLKWQSMETALSFTNVDPEGLEYKDYTLLGEGCYEMDEAPNIIVNRCRIKGRSQEHCASIIKWTK